MRWFLISLGFLIIGWLVFVVSFSFPSQAFDETHLKKFYALNACVGCDLSKANLRGADLSGANLNMAELSKADLNGANLSEVELSTATLRNAKLDGAIFCKTKMPWGEENLDCKTKD